MRIFTRTILTTDHNLMKMFLYQCLVTSAKLEKNPAKYIGPFTCGKITTSLPKLFFMLTGQNLRTANSSFVFLNLFRNSGLLSGHFHHFLSHNLGDNFAQNRNHPN